MKNLALLTLLSWADARPGSAVQHKDQARFFHDAAGSAVNHNDVLARRALAHDMHVDHLRQQDPRHAKTLKYGNNHATRGAHDNALGVGAARWIAYLESDLPWDREITIN